MSGSLSNTSRRRAALLTDWRGPIVLAAFAAAFGLFSGPSRAVTPPPETMTLPSEPPVEGAAAVRFSPILRPSPMALPKLLSAEDTDAYRQAFAAAGRGDAAAMSRHLRQVGDTRIVGHVKAEYLLGAGTRASFAELAQWLHDHADLPDAPAVHALALSRAPKGKPRSLPRPHLTGRIAQGVVTDLGPGKEPPAPPGRAGLAPREATARDRLKIQINTSIRSAELDRAETLALGNEARRLLSEAEIDYFRTRIAAGLFARDEEKRAYDLASAAARRSGDQVPRAHWVAGLAAFAQSRFETAAGHFETLARTPRVSSWEISAAAFWAARTHLHDRNFDRVTHWLVVAADHPRSFYGLLALRLLGQTLPFNWESPGATREEIAALRRLPGGTRAFLLIEVGQPNRAETELAALSDNGNRSLQRAMLAVALRSNMVGLATRLGRGFAAEDGRRFEATTYPIPPWQPSDGFLLDPALIYAFMRQESRFDPRAVSPAGARGLMQLMPGTAKLLHGAPVPPARLHNPVFNVTLGQRYLVQLLESETVGGDLIKLAASYNAGPQTVVRWKQRRDQREEDVRDDALLAIETLPSPETRHFITRVLYSYWMYAERLGQPAPSLDAVAEGRWPGYVPPVFLTARASPGNAKDR
jgi:soluble lytic murein transglycosylase